MTCKSTHCECMDLERLHCDALQMDRRRCMGSVSIPVHILRTLIKQPTKSEAWMRRAARHYINHELRNHTNG